MTTTDTDPKDPPEYKYGTFNVRMIASTLDICLLFVVALPAVDFFMSQAFPPINMAPIMQVLGSPEITSNPEQLLRALWKVMSEQSFIERFFVENILQVAFIALYIIPCWFRYSTTPGKMLFRLQILDEKTGERMSDRQAVKRFLGYFLSALPLTLGFVWIVFDKRRRGFHDMFAGTIVVRKPKNAQTAPTTSSSSA